MIVNIWVKASKGLKFYERYALQESFDRYSEGGFWMGEVGVDLLRELVGGSCRGGPRSRSTPTRETGGDGRPMQMAREGPSRCDLG